MSEEQGLTATAEVEATTAVPESFVAPDGAFSEGWKENLPEDLRVEKSLDTFKTVQDLAKSFVVTKKMLGKDKVILPNDRSSPAEVEEFYNALGRPKTKEDYKLDKPKDLPDEYWNQDILGQAKEVFHKIGLTQKQVEAIVKFDNDRLIRGLQQNKQDSELSQSEAESLLHQDWGNAYDQKIHIGNVAIEEGVSGNQEFKQRLIDKFGNDPDFIRFASNLGSKFAEHGSNDPAIPTPGDIDEQIREIMQSPQYNSRDLSVRKPLIEKVMRLREQKLRSQQRIA
jgi:hypothetical protein